MPQSNEKDLEDINSRPLNVALNSLDAEIAEVEMEIEDHSRKLKVLETYATSLRTYRNKLVSRIGPVEGTPNTSEAIRRLILMKPRSTDEIISMLSAQLPARDRLTDPARRIRSTINLLISRGRIIQENGINRVNESFLGRSDKGPDAENTTQKD